MSRGQNVFLALAARWLTALITLFAFLQLAAWPAGTGVGFVAGLAMGMGIVLNALIFGVGSVLAVVPPALQRAILAIGLVMALAGAGLPNFAWSGQLREAGAFATTASAMALISLAFMGRAGALREAQW